MMKYKPFICVIVIGMVLFISAPHSRASDTAKETIKWVSYDDAQALIKEKPNKVFLYFFSTNCYYCGLMEKNTFSNSILARYVNENFIPVRVNSDKEKTLSRNFHIRGNPTNYFLTENFEIIGNLPGYLPPADLLNILKYVHTDSFKKMTLGEFLQKDNP